MAGMNFRLLEVDLTTRTTKVTDVTKEVETYLGGRGLWNKLAWDRMPQGADPLGPDNLLHVGVGPITGLIGCKTVFSFKSPLTGWAGRATMSGYFGEEVMTAGYNAGILITGKADRPSYLYVYDDKVEIRDAGDLWGKWKQEAEVTLRDRLRQETGKEFGVAVIGPAGEHLVAIANVTTEFVHSASKWGVGAVMGSKNLKAIAVKGTKGHPMADHKAVWELFKQYALHPETDLRRLGESKYGHTLSMPRMYHAGQEGIKNNHLGWHEVCLGSNAHKHYLKYQAWADGCPGCAAACFVPFFKNTDHGAFGGEFRHDNTGGFNANILVGYEEMTEINGFLDEMGMDGECMGGLTAWCMDMYERGIITKSDLDGIDLKWGSVEATIQFLKKVAYREGRVPNLIADGWRKAEAALGPEAAYLAWEVHGAGAPTYDVRSYHSRRKEYVTSHNGARMGSGISDGGLTETATICRFASPPFEKIWGSLPEAARLFLNAAAGWNLTPEQLEDIMVRNYYLGRCMSLREGYHPAKDDYLPQRAYDEPITNKYGKTFSLTKEQVEQEKKEFYVKSLRLTETGLPPRSELQRLGLEFVIPVLDPMKAIG